MSLGDEPGNVPDYRALESLRLTARLKWVVDFDGRAQCVHVPTMLVQTWVENAIKHGIAQLPANSPLKKARRRMFERYRCDLEADESRISGIFEVSPTKRACRFRQKDEEVSSSAGCEGPTFDSRAL